jgi:hypothetical protein
MKIFVLERKEGCPNSRIGGYGQYEGFVVTAQDANAARQLVYQHTGISALTERFVPADAEMVWLETKNTSCKSIGQPTTRTLNEISQVILSIYHPG